MTCNLTRWALAGFDYVHILHVCSDTPHPPNDSCERSRSARMMSLLEWLYGRVRARLSILRQSGIHSGTLALLVEGPERVRSGTDGEMRG